ncbi:MAG: hypothetical protein K5925_03010 [Bacilli bacterium]|nr:hypothetical protein [Bacilli bacterium]
MNRKTKLSAFFGVVVLPLSVVACASDQPNKAELNSYQPTEHTVTFDKNTELASRDGMYIYENGPGIEDDVEISLGTISSYDPDYKGRSTPHYIGKCDGNDSFLFFYDLQVGEGFSLSMRLPNLKNFHFDYYLSDNEDENAIDILWEVDQYHPALPAFYDKSRWSSSRLVTAGQRDEVWWTYSEMSGNYVYNYLFIKCHHNVRDATFRLGSLTCTWVS